VTATPARLCKFCNPYIEPPAPTPAGIDHHRRRARKGRHDFGPNPCHEGA
jgi:hypothetical protein